MSDANEGVSGMYDDGETLEQARMIAFAQLDSGRGIVVTEGDDNDLQLWLADVGRPTLTLAQVVRGRSTQDATTGESANAERILFSNEAGEAGGARAQRSRKSASEMALGAFTPNTASPSSST